MLRLPHSHRRQPKRAKNERPVLLLPVVVALEGADAVLAAYAIDREDAWEEYERGRVRESGAGC